MNKGFLGNNTLAFRGIEQLLIKVNLGPIKEIFL